MPLGAAETQSKINRAPSPLLARTLPWITVVLASILQTLPFIASAPIMPPLGFLALLAWRQLRPGLLPVWAGFPLGFADDVFSGQTFGTATLLWSIMMLSMDVIEQRFPWRSYLMDWTLGALIVTIYLLAGAVLAPGLGNGGNSGNHILLLGPQMLTSIFVFPLVERVVALCDRTRLWRFRTSA